MKYKNIVGQVVQTLISNEARRATKYISEKLVIKATRRFLRGKFHRDNIEIFLTIGRPNYLERDFVKKCRKAGEPFPVKKIQLKFPSKKKR